MANQVEIFISYSPEDEALRIELETSLKSLERGGLIHIWHHLKINPGAEQSSEIDAHLNAAHIILLLVSPAYIDSDACYEEMLKVMKRRETEATRVIPVLLRPVHWENSPIGKLEPLPKNRNFVNDWSNKGKAFYEIAEGIRKVVEDLAPLVQAKGPFPSPQTHTSSSPQEASMPNNPSPGQPVFDVFLCHNKNDKPEVKKIGEALKARGIKPWLDEWELAPGLPWQRELERQIQQVKSAAVFVGADGQGPWQQMELDGFLREIMSRGCPVIPVLLPTAPKIPALPVFLAGMTWVNFHKQVPDPMDQLIWGITGKRPGMAGGSDGQVAQGQTAVPVAAPAASASLSVWERNDLEQRRDELQRLYALRNKKAQRLREALAIEIDVSTTIKYEEQLAREEAALASIKKELEEVKQKLQ